LEKKLTSPNLSLLFVSLIQIDSLDTRSIYHDLLRYFVNKGHYVYIISPVERRSGLKTKLTRANGYTILYVRTFNIQKAALIEKILGTLSFSFILNYNINKYLKFVKLDIILFPTPPITLYNTIYWLKNKTNAKTYLLLKDIFPQNAVDLKYFKFGGLIHRYFSEVEKKLYAVSDRIGCMSDANYKYLIERHPKIVGKLEVNPNSIEIRNQNYIRVSKSEVFSKYGIPLNSTIYLYSGNIGRPQGSIFLIDIILKGNELFKNAFFLIVGSGTEFKLLDKWFHANKPSNAILIKHLPKNQFDELAYYSDVGIILLKKEFSIPNFPSRLLSYLEFKMPILAITDNVSDIGRIAVENGFGLWSEHGDIEKVILNIAFYEKNTELRKNMGLLGYNYMCNNYDVRYSYEKIINAFK
jgi:glycosyltransferase involved in cell wall biosynthesis